MNPPRFSPGRVPSTAPWRPRGAFTLVEVVLALAIATGLLIAALLFYRQATQLRGQILRESDRCTAVRLVVDRLVADLRETVSDPAQGDFLGGADALSFLRHAPFESGMTNAGLVRISFFARRSGDGTNAVITAFDRNEQKLLAAGWRIAPTNSAAVTPANHPQEPMTEDVRYIRFRYWDGAAWLAAWTNSSPPAGVEILLGPDPLPAEAEGMPNPYANPNPDSAGAAGSISADPGSEVVRRVVALPAGLAARRPVADGFPDTSIQ